MVENQAIARVLRLGQKRNVRVVRYTMKGTVEEVRDYRLLTIKEAN
jgi:SNF2 family DNA or RNA helicase